LDESGISSGTFDLPALANNADIITASQRIKTGNGHQCEQSCHGAFMPNAVSGRFTLFIFISGAVVDSGKSPVHHTTSGTHITDITDISAGFLRHRAQAPAPQCHHGTCLRLTGSLH